MYASVSRLSSGLPEGHVESVSDDGVVQVRLPDGNLLRRRVPLEQVPGLRQLAAERLKPPRIAPVRPRNG